MSDAPNTAGEVRAFGDADGLPQNPQPITFPEARALFRDVANRRRWARQGLEEAIKDCAKKEAEYRTKFATALVRDVARGSTVTEAEAQARKDAADEMQAFRIAEGMIKAKYELLEEIDGERAMLNRLAEWSQKIDPYGQGSEGEGDGGGRQG